MNKINVFSLGLITKPSSGEEYNTRQLYDNIVKIIEENKDAEGQPDKGLDVSIQDADFQGRYTLKLVGLTRDFSKFLFESKIGNNVRKFSDFKSLLRFFFELKTPPVDYEPYLKIARQVIFVHYRTEQNGKKVKCKISLAALIPEGIYIQLRNDKAMKQFDSAKKKERLEDKKEEDKRKRQQEKVDKEEANKKQKVEDNQAETDQEPIEKQHLLEEPEKDTQPIETEDPDLDFDNIDE